MGVDCLSRVQLVGEGLKEYPEELSAAENCSKNSKLVLDKIQELNLSDNALSHVPPTIRQLVSLTTLDLTANELKELPHEIGQVRNLLTDYLTNYLPTYLIECLID